MKKFIIILFLTLINIGSPCFAQTNVYLNLNWWNSFNDTILVQNLLKVAEKNYDLKNAALKIKENEQVVKMQFADELPTMAFSGELYRDLQAPRKQMGNFVVPKYSQYNYNLPITAGYEIDIWGKNRFKTKSKKAQLEIIKQAERATYIALTSDFAVDYYNLIKADKLIEIQEELINIQEDILKKEQERFKVGLCNINVVLEEEKFLAALKKEHSDHLKTRDVLINTLKVYLTDEDEISRSKYETVTLLKNIPMEYSSDIITNRPDFKQDEYNLKRIGFDIKVARREFLPSFVIFGQIGLNAYHVHSLFNPKSQYFSAGILPSMDLFSGGRKRAFLKIKKYQYEQALNDYKKTLLLGVKEVNSGLAEYKSSMDAYREVEKRINTESKIYNLAMYKQQIGAASKLDELYAKELYLIMKKEEVSSKINSIISTIGLYKAVGGVDLRKINEDI